MSISQWLAGGLHGVANWLSPATQPPICPFLQCNQPCASNPNGGFYLGCGKAHSVALNNMPQPLKFCSFPNCGKVCFVDQNNGQYLPACSAAHDPHASQPQMSVPQPQMQAPQCPVAGCGRSCAPNPNGGFFQACSRTHSAALVQIPQQVPCCGLAGCTKGAAQNPAGGFFPGCCRQHSVILLNTPQQQ